MFVNSFLRFRAPALFFNNRVSCMHNIQKMVETNSSTLQNRNLSSSSKVLDLEINRLVWIDMEMTGLNIKHDGIMEIACLITDSDLNILAEGPDIIVHQPTSVLENMKEWCVKQHGSTGLSKACLESKLSVHDAENQLMSFITQHVTDKASPLAGNSVYMDRLFIRKFLPKVDAYLHYRIIDVSTVKELCRRWNPELFKNIPKKEFTHRALADIKESLKELQFYRKEFFKL